MAIKGSSLIGHPTIGRPSDKDITYKGKTIKSGVQLWPVGSSTIKSTIYSRLKIDTPGPRYIHFYVGLDDDFYKQLTSEKCITRYDKDGVPKRVWVLPRGSRNEVLDCISYSRAAAVRAGLERIDWDKLETLVNYRAAKQNPDNQTPLPDRPPNTRPKRRIKRSNYMTGGL